MIPAFLLEEHHEAFAAWGYAIHRGYIPPLHNVLLHVDEHADLQIPALLSSMHDLRACPWMWTRVVRHELGIGDFILPAIYLRVFSQILWMKRTHRTTRAYPLHLATQDGDGRTVLRTSSAVQAGLLDPLGHCTAQVCHVEANTPAINAPAANVVLDVDLDYFFSDDLHAEQLDVQITEHEFAAYHADCYHRARLAGTRIRAVKRDGAYYFRFTNPNLRPSSPFSRATVGQRIVAFASWLHEQPWTPGMITICRSARSGFVPAAQAPWMEAELLAALREGMALDVYSIADVERAWS